MRIFKIIFKTIFNKYSVYHVAIATDPLCGPRNGGSGAAGQWRPGGQQPPPIIIIGLFIHNPNTIAAGPSARLDCCRRCCPVDSLSFFSLLLTPLCFALDSNSSTATSTSTSTSSHTHLQITHASSLTNMAATTQSALPPQLAFANPGQMSIYGHPSPSNSTANTPANSSPTSPQMSSAALVYPSQSRQIRPPKAPLYVPAVLRPTERPSKASSKSSSPITPPRSVHGSLDSLNEEPHAPVARQTTIQSVKAAADEAIKNELLGEVTGVPTRDHWKVSFFSFFLPFFLRRRNTRITRDKRERKQKMAGDCLNMPPPGSPFIEPFSSPITC